jgi:hypothetical protein
MARLRVFAGTGIAAAALALAAAGCDLTLTGEPVRYADLDPDERAAADRIYANLRAFDARFRAARGSTWNLGLIAQDVERVDVSVSGLWVFTNLGDDRVHVTTWENLAASNRERWVAWFGPGDANARARYQVFFYDLVALHLAGIQAVYAVQGVAWVYENRSVFNLDRDAQRLAVTYLAEFNSALLAQVSAYCGTITGLFGSRWAAHYDQSYYLSHFRELTDPDDPAGQLYFLCRHLQDADLRRRTYNTRFADEIGYVRMRTEAAGPALD